MAAFVAMSVVVFYAFWLLFSGTFAIHELLIGGVAALLATVGLIVINLQYPARFSPTFTALFAIWRIPWYLITGTWEIAMVALKDALGMKPAQSIFRIARFDAGKPGDAVATARRVLAVVYTTIAPNFIVLGVNSSDQLLLFHQIKRSPVPKMTQELGALK
ncbi:MAG TPA: hypothetical protein VG498_11345 [Terriglobales bacterium]|nr:hypothetical protein [Terriglobales bacterium]